MKNRILVGVMAVILMAGIAQAAPDDDTAKKLLREAQGVLSRDMDSVAAQRLLERAMVEAVSNEIKGRVLLEIAYVAWFRMEPIARVRELLGKAVSRIGPPTQDDETYTEEFLKQWKRVARKGAAPRSRHFRIDGAVNKMAAVDNRFVTAYGRWHTLPELRLAIRVHSHLFAWVSGASFSFSGTLPVVDREVNGFQKFLAVGGGWAGELSRNFSFFITAGPQMTWVEENSRIDQVSGNYLGFLVRADLEWYHKSGFFLFLTAGYGGASFEWSGRRLRSGGARVGGGMGVNF